MVGKADVPVRKASCSESFSFDREEDFKDWQRKRDKSERTVALLAWMIIMILATVAGFGIGFLSKNVF
ncbi:hypothetical protein D3C76_1034330 [compost metagenome]